MQENLLWRFICMQFVITLSLHHDIWSCQTKNPVYLVKVSLSLSNWQSSVTCHNCLRYVFKSNHLTVTDVSGITFGYPLGNINLFRTDQQKRSGLLFVKHLKSYLIDINKMRFSFINSDYDKSIQITGPLGSLVIQCHATMFNIELSFQYFFHLNSVFYCWQGCILILTPGCTCLLFFFEQARWLVMRFHQNSLLDFTEYGAG